MVRTSGPIVLALTLAAILAAGCTERPNRVVQQEPAQRQRGFHFEGNNCPDHTPIRFVLANDSAVTLDALSVSGKITLIPEFHDCQRLIDDTGLKYGPLVGVYVSFLNAQIPALPPIPVVRRPSLSGGRPTQARVPTGASTITAATTAIAAAELVAFDGDYDTLGIKLGFNCLYLLNDGSATRVTARMVPVGQNESDCGKKYDPAMGGKVLTVTPELPVMAANDYPPVARWEWDPVHNIQVIGIKCQFTWCNVAPKGVDPSAAMEFTSGELPDPKERRTFVIRGWHDEQRLGVPIGAGKLGPGVPVGTVVPDKNLGKWNDVSDFKRWKPVARIFFSPNSAVYQTKFGFAGDAGGTPPHVMTQVSFCQGTSCFHPGETPPTGCHPDASGTTWYARIDPIGATKPIFRCVIRQVMTSGGTIYDPPATARWRWSETDETLWARCAQGCCQVG